MSFRGLFRLPAVFLLSGAFVLCEVPWETVPPETEGVNPERLEAMRAELAARGTKELVVVRHGKIVFEWYADGYDASRKHYTASLAKALVGGVTLMLAIDEGRIAPDDLASKYIPAWRRDPRKSKITIRQLATHTSGIEDAEQDDIPHMKLPGWKGDFWRKDPDPFTMAIRHAPVIFEPGTEYAYSNPGMAALAYAVTAAMDGRDLRTLLRERVMRPLGVPDEDWSIGYGQTYKVDGLPLVANWGGGNFTARAAARVGQWMIQRGAWDGKALVDEKVAMSAMEYAGMPKPPRPPGNPQPASGLAWYTNFDSVWPQVPRDAFAGAGAGNQVMLVVPSMDIVVVRQGSLLARNTDDGMFWGGIEKFLFNPLMEAVREGAGKPPYPQSQVIRGIEFEPVSGITCRASSSDNWPITWADDGYLYTSYGDGWGFEPKVEKKLSQGFARVSGWGENFTGENIRTESGETLGDGPKGAKASGMLMVDGVLYVWTRNVGNSQLMWSEDHGKTWKWGFKFTESFGSPAFLNMGRNYEGARDNYVYTYSQAGPSAYGIDDGLVLARVDKNRIRERDAYEFFVRKGSDGKPVWSSNILDIGLVFDNLRDVQRVDAVYNPGLGRYLLALGYGHRGGWGIFDAPEPWGPWTTAFHTPYWGLGSTHGYRLPSKWISQDGRTMHLIFSGRKHNGILWDAFCVRRFSLLVN